MGKIITPDEDRRRQAKPWLQDIDQLRQEIQYSSQITMARADAKIGLFKAETLIMFGEIDNAVITAAHLLLNPAVIMPDGKIMDILSLKQIINMWYFTKDHLSKDFVDKNPELCKHAIKMLEQIKTLPGFNKKHCNEIINRLYQKKEDIDETVDELDKSKNKET